jgi:hypothetical protein
MFRKLSLSLPLALMATLAVAPATMSQDRVEGTMDLAWNDCYPGAPNLEVPDWVGTVDFDGDVYDIIFWVIAKGYPPGLEPNEGFNPFVEAWAVYDGLELVFDDECAMQTLEGELVMWGHHTGRTNRETKEYAAAGKVLEAYGAFDGYAGSDDVMSGTVLFDDEGAPETAPGIIAIG